ncbi:MAG: family 78 glycoside hydrolase catalytic domain [Ferruginibacter sp.]
MKYYILVSFLMMGGFSMGQKLSVTSLRCANKQYALGIDDAAPGLSWELVSKERNVMQTAYRVLVSTDSLLLKKNIGNVWDSKKMISGASVQVAYAGKTLESAKKYYWKVMAWDNKGHASGFSRTTFWQMGLISAKDWGPAQWVAYEVLPDSNQIIPFAHGNGEKKWGARKDILPLLRKTFLVDKPVKSAVMFICGLGQFELNINGKKTGDHFLDPGWTKYDKHALYVSFDVTKQLKPGVNAIGVMLGNGFYYIPGERYRKITGAFAYPKMICRMVIEYNDGSIDNVYSNASWKTVPSPIIFSSIYGGEDYDANLEQKGWDTPSFNDTQWKNVAITTGPLLQSQTAGPLKVMETFSSIKSTKIKPGVWLYDMGQNASGIPQITVKGKKGDTIKIVTAELINEDGTANQKATGSPSYYQYILKGGGPETWQPRFTYYGFRYIQIANASGPGVNNAGPNVVTRVTALHTRNSAVTAGSFSCSNELFNKTHTLIDWAIKSNMASVLTDCPHREKLGWLEEAHLMGSSVKFRYDIATLCRKIIRDMIMSQAEDGLVPEIAPEFVQFEEPFRDSPEWGSNCIILPWYVYQWYGDKQSLQEAYPMMQRYVAYLEKKSNGHILTQGLGDWYDLGPNSPGVSQLTPKGLTATAIYYYDLTILEMAAQLLGKTADVKEYGELAESVKAAFNTTYFNTATKQYGTGSQTSNAVSVYMKLVDAADKEAVIDNMVKEIRSRNNSLSAGDIGYRYLLKVLDESGRSDVIFDMNNRSDVPGYGYQLSKGATALTESWQALPTVSNNHFMLGHIMEWFYEGLAGICEAEDAVAFNKIIIRPQPVGDIRYAKATYQSAYGLIKSGWKITGNIFELNVEVPVNTSAAIYLPIAEGAKLFEGTRNNLKMVNAVNIEKGKAIVAIGSGNYHFTVK